MSGVIEEFMYENIFGVIIFCKRRVVWICKYLVLIIKMVVFGSCIVFNSVVCIGNLVCSWSYVNI